MESRLSNNRIHKYLALAQSMCQYSDNKKATLGSVLICKNKVISVGWNMENKTSPIQKEYNKLRGYDTEASVARNTIHAEMNCLLHAKEANIDWGKANLFIYRVKKTGDKGLAKPCNACMAFAKSLGIKNFYYSTEDGFCYERID